MISKLKTALCGAAMLGCVAVPAAANPHNIGNLAMVGPAESTRVVHFDVLLPLRNKDKLEALVSSLSDPSSSQYRKWLTPAQFGAQFGPDAATISRVANWYSSRGFTVKKETRSVRVTGTVDQVARAMGAQLVLAKSDAGTTHVVASQLISVPKDIADTGAKILSFSSHVAHVNSRVGPKLDVGSHIGGNKNPVENRYGNTGSYWFTDLRQAYQYPAVTDTVTVGSNTLPYTGVGATIATLISSDVFDSDVQAMFDHENWSTVSGTPDPVLAGRIYINGGAPFNGDGGFEASLDVQQEIGGAPGANVVDVDIPDLSDGSIMAALTDVDEYGFVDVLSMSFGQCEQDYAPSLNGGQSYYGVPLAEHELFLQGNAEGITFIASSGDEAGKQCPPPKYFQGQPSNYVAGVSLPASDPNVTAVGGTNLVTTYVQGSRTSAYAGENAWSDPEYPNDPYGVGVSLTGHVWGAGGGYSKLFAAPAYQSKVTTNSTMRALPDIGMQVGGCPFGASDYHPKQNACFVNNPQDGNGNSQRSSVVTAVAVGQGGGFYALIGTSVSAPEFASVVAHLIEKNGGRMGNVNPYIYNKAANQAAGMLANPAYHTNIPGYNGVVNTNLNSTYSLSVGVGTPLVNNFLGTPSAAPAGDPQTTTNP